LRPLDYYRMSWKIYPPSERGGTAQKFDGPICKHLLTQLPVAPKHPRMMDAHPVTKVPGYLTVSRLVRLGGPLGEGRLGVVGGQEVALELR